MQSAKYCSYLLQCSESLLGSELRTHELIVELQVVVEQVKYILPDATEDTLPGNWWLGLGHMQLHGLADDLETNRHSIHTCEDVRDVLLED